MNFINFVYAAIILLAGAQAFAQVLPGQSLFNFTVSPSLLNNQPHSKQDTSADTSTDSEHESCPESNPTPAIFTVPQCEPFRNQAATYCKCINEADLESNYLLKELTKSRNKDSETKQKEFKKTYEEKFFSTYAQMTFEEGIQRKILNFDEEDEKKVTCDPKRISSLVNQSFNKFVEDEKALLKDKEIKVKQEMANLECNTERSHYSAFHRITHMSQTLTDVVSGRTRGSYQNRCNSLNQDLSAINKRLIEIDTDDFKSKTIGDDNCGGQSIESKIELAVHELNFSLKLIENEKKANDVDQDELKRLESSKKEVLSKLNRLKAIEMDLENKKASNDSTLPICIWSPEAEKIIADLKKNPPVEIPGESFGQSTCEEDDAVCNEFNSKNLELLDQISDRYSYDDKIRSENCVSYGEFKTFKSLPKDNAFFKEMASNPMKFLNPTNMKGSLAGVKLEFLRENPVLSKLVQEFADKPDLLNEPLKKFANEIQTKNDDGEKLKLFLDFLKSLKNFDKSSDKKGADAQMCVNMARNFTAIQVSNELPPIPKDQSLKSTEIDNILSKIEECKQSSKKVVETNMVATFKQDPLFSLAPEKPAQTLLDETEEYKKYVNDFCPNYKDYFAKNCISKTQEKDIESCRNDYLDQTLLKGQKTAFDNAGAVADPVGDTESFSRVASFVSPAATDSKTEAIYEETLKHMDLSPVAFKGHEHEFKASRQAEHNFFSSYSYPASFATPSPTSTPLASKDPTIKEINPSNKESSENFSKSNPGQVIPSYSSPSSSAPVTFNPAALSPGRTVADAIPEYKSMQPEEKVKNLEAAKQFMKKSAWSPEKIKTSKVDEELAEAKKKLEEEQLLNEKLKNTNRKIASVPTPEFAPAATTNSALPQMAANQNAGLSSGFGLSGASMSPESSSAKAAAPRLFVPNAHVHVKDGVVSAKEFKGPQTSSKDLIVQDSSKFKLLTKDPKVLEAYLKKEMSGMAIGDYKIVTIINKSPNNPVPHLIFRVKQNKDGSFDIQSVPPEVPVRVATLKGLLNQLPKQ